MSSKTSDKSNPAKRVCKILRAAKSKQRNKSTAGVWAEIFSLKETDTPGVFRNLVKLQDELEEVERGITEIEEEPEPYLQHFGKLQKAIAPTNLAEGWDSTYVLLSEEVLQSLDFCSLRLNKTFVENDVPEDTLRKLSEEINEIIEQIIQSDLPLSAKRVLGELASTFDSALKTYRIRGSKGLVDALYNAIRTLERFGESLKPEQGKPVLKRVYDYISRWQTIASAHNNTVQIWSQYGVPLLSLLNTPS